MTKVMILATDGFEQSELMKPKENLENAGIETTVVSLEAGEIKGWDQKDWGKSVKVDMTIGDASAEDFDALLLPGGQMNPDILRMNKKAVEIVKMFRTGVVPVKPEETIELYAFMETADESKRQGGKPVSVKET